MDLLFGKGWRWLRERVDDEKEEKREEEKKKEEEEEGYDDEEGGASWLVLMCLGAWQGKGG